MRTSRRAGRGGFTLVELLIALSILLIFGVMAATALTYGTQLWRSAHRRSYAFDVATFVFQQLEDDLGAARSQFWAKDEDAFDTRVKFWVDHDGEFNDPPGKDRWKTVGGRQRLRFVRGIPDSAVNPRLRQAGDGQDNDVPADGNVDEEYYNLKDDDGNNGVDEDLMPLEGMCEVAYMLGRQHADGDDRRTLYRAALAPIGRTDSHPDVSGIEDAGHTFFHEDIFDDPQHIRDKSVRLADNILHFEVRLWTQYTTTWDLWEDDGDRMEFAPWQSSYEPEQCPPIFTWDSDRLADEDPDFLMDPGQTGFPSNTDDDDEDYVRDNVFPRSVMVVLVVDPAGEYPSPRTLRLRNQLIAGGDEVVVDGELPAYNKSWPYIRINYEWIRFESFEPDERGGTFTIADPGRHVRGTAAAGHNAGDEVRFGITFTRVFHNPANREHWGQ